MKSHRIAAGGGAELNVVEGGDPQGRAILFLHGASQCWLQWSRQMESSLGQKHRLVAMDLRGHGLSDKPREGYNDSKLWADDLNAVIQALNLDRPVLSGWSYGPLVSLDYVRHYGEERIGGLHFIGAVTKLGSDDAMSVLTPELLGIFGDFLSSDAEASVRGSTGLLRLCYPHEPSPSEQYQMLGYNVSVPPYVRQALFSRSFSNDDLLPKIRKPVLITHGTKDAVVRPTAVDKHKALIPQAEVHMMANAGHAAFWDDAPRFNERLHAFCQNL
ncbi:MAG TPA: alpha/beta hydrolase [Candidatus Sulfotelmatobacter sp.]|nr:alpha/beta hydrolase [Candidatus Sulfotelmatobacter sp.]